LIETSQNKRGFATSPHGEEMIPQSTTIGRGGRLSGALACALLAAAALSGLSGCSTYDSLTQRVAQSITPYRITIVQGNFVSSEAAAQMRVGMSRAEVRQLLGTPLLTDMFHTNRWDYIFYFKRGSTAVVQQRDFVVNFDGDRVSSWSGGDDLPSNLELLAEIDGDRSGKKKAAAPAPASAAVAAAAASEAAAAAVGPTVGDTTRSPSAELGTATSALPQDPNAQAAAAANRATDAVQTPSGLTPSVRAGTPTSSALPPGVGTMPSQIQLHRPPPPQIQGVQPNPVGPTAGAQGTGDTNVAPPAPSQNAPLTAPPTVPAAPAGASGAAGTGG
jgi:outer membrane protein assembly factor BamE